jgi:hypothetical protein
MSKARERNKAFRRWLRSRVAQGISHDADGNEIRPSITADGRGMHEQRMAGYRVGPWARKTKKQQEEEPEQ